PRREQTEARIDFPLLIMDLAFPSEPFSKNTDADRRGRSALRPTLTANNLADSVLGLGPGWRGLSKHVPPPSRLFTGLATSLLPSPPRRYNDARPRSLPC